MSGGQQHVEKIAAVLPTRIRSAAAPSTQFAPSSPSMALDKVASNNTRRDRGSPPETFQAFTSLQLELLPGQTTITVK